MARSRTRKTAPAPLLLSSTDLAQLESSATVDGVVEVTFPGNLEVFDAVHQAVNGFTTGDEDDVLLGHPEGVRWSVAELEEQVVRPTRMGALGRRHLVIAEAHSMAPVAFDRLLKTFEEMPEDVTVWLLRPVSTELPPTLAGRCSRRVHLSGPGWEESVDRLAQELDCGAGEAEEWLRAAHGRLDLAAAAGRFDLREALADYGAGYPTSSAQTAASRLVAAAAHLAVALGHKTSRPPVAPVGKGIVPIADLSRLNPRQRATLRRLVTAALQRWRDETLAALGALNTEAAAARLESLEAGLRGLSMNAPVPTAVAASVHPFSRGLETYF